MDDYTRTRFDKLDRKLDSYNDELQNNNIIIKEIKNDLTGVKGDITGVKGDITEIKSNILQNCKKLDDLSSDVKEIKELLQKD